MKIIEEENYKQRILIGLVPTIVVWLVIGLLHLLAKTISIDDAQIGSFTIYTDQELQGHSTATTIKTESEGIVFTYTLKQGYPYPYAGVCFTPKSGQFNFKQNSNFEIEIKTEAGRVIPVILNEEVTSLSGKEFQRPVVYELKTQAGQHTYSIPLQAFAVPSWWYKEKHFSETDFPAFNAAHIKNICVQNSLLAPLDQAETIYVVQLKNTPEMSFWIWIGTIFSVCWSGGYAVYLITKKKKTAVFIPYVTTPSDEVPKNDWEKIRNYIAANYMHEIDMEGMEKVLGIAKHRLAQLIKENTTLIFKQYLNQVKVAEAKRLLQETNLPIGEIADQAGFGHVSNFNRVFKQYTGESPSDLRSKITVK
jgi:AraC-like DNA-binding protein